MEKSDKGTPRLVAKEGYYITANEDFVAPINLDSIQGYITHAPKAIEIVKSVSYMRMSDLRKILLNH